MKFVPANNSVSARDGWFETFGHAPELIILALLIAFFAFAFTRSVKTRSNSKGRKSTWHGTKQQFPHLGNKRRAKTHPKSTSPSAKKIYPQLAKKPRPNMAEPTNQMHAIAKVQFECTSLLNKEEARLLPLLESIAQRAGQGFRVMAQTSMGEVLKPKKGTGSSSELKDAFASINSKRLDFAIFNRSGRLVCAIEYQGSGHYQGNAFMRDTIKREVLRRANVPFIEAPQNFTPEDIERSVARILSPVSLSPAS